MAQLLAINGRGRLWHTDEAKEEAVKAMADALGNLCVPMPDFSDGQKERVPFFDPPTIELMRQVVCNDVDQHEYKPTHVTPLKEDGVPKAKQELRKVGMVGFVWDKWSTKFYAVRSELRNSRLLTNTLGGSRFAIWGWCASSMEPHRVIIT